MSDPEKKSPNNDTIRIHAMWSKAVLAFVFIVAATVSGCMGHWIIAGMNAGGIILVCSTGS